MLTSQQILEARAKLGISSENGVSNNSNTGTNLLGKLRNAVTPDQGFLSRVGTKLGERFDTIGEIRTKVQAGEKSDASAILQTAGQLAGAVLDPVSEVVATGLEATGLDKPLATAVGAVAENTPVKSVIDFYKGLSPEAQKNVDAVFNIGSLIPTALLVKPVAGAVKTTAKTAVKSVGDIIPPGGGAAGAVIEGAVDMTKRVTESLARVPARVAINVAEKKAAEASIKALPRQTAQTAVRDGVDIQDVKNLTEVIPNNKTEVSKLVTGVRDFANGTSKVDPIEIVGAPVVNRLKVLEKQKAVVGVKLGEASKTIGILTKPELQGGVIARLKKVPGLENISLTKTGQLNFKGTTLESNLGSAVADRKAIAEAFREATKWGDGERAHRFRQTLFENLGGKKKSLANITDTQEKAFDSIRSGLSDVIESKSVGYKAFSREYAKIVNPIREIKKLMKALDPNFTDSDLSMSAGLIARRLTSASLSNPKVMATLRSLGGETAEQTKTLQDIYNILNRYYDIAPKTGFQNLSKEAGIGASDSVMGIIKATAKDIAGQSNAVRTKSLENLLDELLKSN